MSEQPEKALSNYEKCGTGRFHPMRTHSDGFGWAVVYAKTGVIFALVGAKGCAFGLSAALNGHWEAAQEFIDGDVIGIDDGYMDRFKRP